MPSILLSLSLSFFGEVDGCDAGDGDVDVAGDMGDGDGDDMGDGDVENGDVGDGDDGDGDGDDMGDGDDEYVLPLPGCRPSKALNCPTRSRQQQCTQFYHRV